jgi:hypothetical protein
VTRSRPLLLVFSPDFGGIHWITTTKSISLLRGSLEIHQLLLHSPLFLLLFCRARWLMSPDVPQPVRLIVLTLL